MIIRLSREHTINTGNYENIKVGGSVEFDSDNEGLAESEINSFARDALDALLADDLKAALAAVPEDQTTHIEFWRK